MDLEKFDEDFFETNINIIKKNVYEQICDICNSDQLLLIPHESCITCQNCGCENKIILDRSPEWSNFEDKNEGSARCGPGTNPHFPSLALATTVSGKGFHKLRKMHNWGQTPYSERSLSDVYQLIDDKCSSAKIPKSIRESAKCIYNKLTDVKHDNGAKIIFRGKNRKGMIAACVFLGGLMENTPITNKVVADIFNIDMSQLTKGIKRIEEFLGEEEIIKDINSPEPYKFIKTYHNKLNIPTEYLKVAIRICKNINKLDEISNHHPVSLAAGCIFLISKLYNLDITKKEISVTLDISEVTINKIYSKLDQLKNIITDDELTDLWLIDSEACLDHLNKLNILNNMNN